MSSKYLEEFDDHYRLKTTVCVVRRWQIMLYGNALMFLSDLFQLRQSQSYCTDIECPQECTYDYFPMSFTVDAICMWNLCRSRIACLGRNRK